MFLWVWKGEHQGSWNWSEYYLQYYYSWLLITQTLANLNLELTRTKKISPGFSLYIYCSFTLVPRTLNNSILLLTRSNFCFPSDHFYIILPLITWTLFWVLKRLGKNSVLESKTLDFEVPLIFCRHIVYIVYW